MRTLLLIAFACLILLAELLFDADPAPIAPAATPSERPQQRPEKLSPERCRKSIGPEREREGKG